MTTLVRSIGALWPIAILAAGCATTRPGIPEGPPERPRAEREFRGAWVATVANIDWPSRPGLSTDQQQAEARAILDTCVSLGLNAVILQVRPHCDALYQSSLEPWSAELTGVEGKPPEPFYDPLAFWVEEAHDRGLELHAWFNPYRARMAQAPAPNASSIVTRKPRLVRQLPGGMQWLDPGDPETQQHTFDVVMDVVRRYDVDGIHFDDYFYPYGDGTFPDDTTWNAYVAAGGSLSREDWRRENVNELIRRLHVAIAADKPYVKFGLSPFGIWRPGYPASIGGFDQYSILYADARLWLNEGWIDYFTPQLYWPINQVPQSFPVLLGWWTNENLHGRHLWPGLFTSRLNTPTGVDEVFNEIMVARGFAPVDPGHIHFSMRTFLQDSSALDSTLQAGPYRNDALVPASPWLDDSPPESPSLSVSTDTATLHLEWTHADPADVFRTVVYTEYAGRWEYTILNRFSVGIDLPLTREVSEPVRRRQQPDTVRVRVERLTRVAVSAVDRTGNESVKTFRPIAPAAIGDVSEPRSRPRGGS